MKFKIPFTISPIEKLIKTSKPFSRRIKYKKKSKLKDSLENSGVAITREQYLGICLRGFVTLFLLLLLIFSTIFFFIGLPTHYSLFISLLFATFVVFSQLMYPNVYSKKRERNMEKNLVPALQDMLVQLNSGIPLYTIMLNIAISDYGELSIEFEKIIKKINSGIPEVDVIDEITLKNSSAFFKRVLWQISNGLKSGSDMSIIIKDGLDTLSNEQYIQIQNYGNKLNPFIVFYMLMSVIVPSLSVTFVTIISSIISLPQNLIIGVFISLFIFVFVIQIMFLGLIKSSRPALL